MVEFYNLYIYDLSFKLRTKHNLEFNVSCDLNLTYANVDKNSAVVQPATRGAIILDSLVNVINLRATYNYFSDNFKTQTVNLSLFCPNKKIPFFYFFYHKILSDFRMQNELSYQSSIVSVNSIVKLTNLNMLMKTLDNKNPIAVSGIDFGEVLLAKFIFFNKKKTHLYILNSLIGF